MLPSTCGRPQVALRSNHHDSIVLEKASQDVQTQLKNAYLDKNAQHRRAPSAPKIRFGCPKNTVPREGLVFSPDEELTWDSECASDVLSGLLAQGWKTMDRDGNSK